MAARGLVNGEGPTKWEGFSFPDVTLLPFTSKNKKRTLRHGRPWPCERKDLTVMAARGLVNGRGSKD